MAFVEEVLGIAPARAELWLELAELEAWRGRRDQSEDAFVRAFALLEAGAPLRAGAALGFACSSKSRPDLRAARRRARALARRSR